MSEAKHTPTPYKYVAIKQRFSDGIKTVATIYHGETAVARCHLIEDADFIVHACNAYEANQKLIADMLAALKAAREYIEIVESAHAYALLKQSDKIITRAESRMS